MIDKKLYDLCHWTLVEAKGCPKEIRETAFQMCVEVPMHHVADFCFTVEYYEQIKELIRQGKKIQAIKVFREATGADLKAAKEAVENHLM